MIRKKGGGRRGNLTLFRGAGVVGRVRQFSFGARLPGSGTVDTQEHGFGHDFHVAQVSRFWFFLVLVTENVLLLLISTNY
jgi:hypothetical protein